MSVDIVSSVEDERSADPRFRHSPVPHGTTLRWVVSLPRRFVLPGAALVGVLALGTAGYVLIEGMSAVDALYLTAVTVSTVGYGDVVPVTRAGKLFTVALIMTGVGTVLYLLTQLGKLVIEGQLREVFGRSAMTVPIEHGGGTRVLEELCAFAAATVGEEDEASSIDPLQQHESRGRSALRRGGGNHHCFGDRFAGAPRGSEPLCESRNRISRGACHGVPLAVNQCQDQPSAAPPRASAAHTSAFCPCRAVR